MTIWYKRLSVRLRKRHMYESLLPQVEKSYFVHHFFKLWFGIFAKNRYLNRQLHSMEQMQATEHLATCFQALRLHAVEQIDCRRKDEAAIQQYFHTLVSHSWRKLRANKVH
mmetsp:Transcript_3971/g.5982  ORF Transcript_3971/g.5982 Transcript_3971/m.5982 type:complete len:111 (-) Transcript_3971:1600-1932(-)